MSILIGQFQLVKANVSPFPEVASSGGSEWDLFILSMGKQKVGRYREKFRCRKNFPGADLLSRGYPDGKAAIGGQPPGDGYQPHGHPSFFQMLLRRQDLMCPPEDQDDLLEGGAPQWETSRFCCED